VIGDVLAARAAGADVVIVSVHLSQEMQTGPIPGDRAFVTALTANAPVDAVIMHGPHVIQPIERVNGTLVSWSVGNLISGMGVPGTGRYEDRRTLDGLIAGVRVTESSPGLFTTESWPVVVCLDPATRIVHAGLAELADPSTPPALRAVLQACVDRTRSLVPDVH
jgi:poly-gamma-glutamate synthesis protein (capsule biosynthesis protein)